MVLNIMYRNIKVKKINKLAIIRINRPKFKNSIDIETSKEIFLAAQSIEKNKKIVCILILGNSNSFSAGADIKELSLLNSKKAKLKKLFNYLDKLEEIRIPIISAVEGYAFGGGLELLLITDFIIASKGAKFGQPEVNLGLIPGIGGTQRLKKYIGKYNANYICMLGETFNALEAFNIGLISKILDKKNFEKEAILVAEKLSNQPRSSLIEIKRLIKLNSNIKKELKVERKVFYKLLDSENKKIGINSFLKKTIPIWKN